MSDYFCYFGFIVSCSFYTFQKMNVKQIEIVSVQCAVVSELEKWGNIMGQWSLIANLSIG